MLSRATMWYTGYQLPRRRRRKSGSNPSSKVAFNHNSTERPQFFPLNEATTLTRAVVSVFSCSIIIQESATKMFFV